MQAEAALAERAGVLSVPTLVVYKDGEPVRRMPAPVPAPRWRGPRRPPGGLAGFAGHTYPDSIGTDTLGVPSGPGPQLPLFVAAAAVLAGLGVTAWGMVRALR